MKKQLGTIILSLLGLCIIAGLVCFVINHYLMRQHARELHRISTVQQTVTQQMDVKHVTRTL